jgi:hypothetical protein
VVGLIVGIWWWIDAKNRYKGPVRTIDEAEFDAAAPTSPAIAGGSE